MKFLCYFILIIAFLMFFQTNPFYAFIVIAIIIGTIFIIKRGKNGNSPRSAGMFRSSRYPGQDNTNTTLMTYMTLLQPTQPQPASLDNYYGGDESESFSQVQKESLDLLEVKSTDRQ